MFRSDESFYQNCSTNLELHLRYGTIDSKFMRILFILLEHSKILEFSLCYLFLLGLDNDVYLIFCNKFLWKTFKIFSLCFIKNKNSKEPLETITTVRDAA